MDIMETTTSLAVPVYTDNASSKLPFWTFTSKGSDLVTTVDIVSTTTGRKADINNTTSSSAKTSTSVANTNLRVSGDVLEVVYICVSSVVLITNLVAVIVFLTNRRLRRQLDIKFLISQSVIDFLAGLFLLTNTLAIQSAPENFAGAYAEFTCKYWYSGFPLWVMFLTSTLHLCALSFVKYLAVVHPFFFKIHFTEAKAYLVMVTPLLVSIAFYIGLFETSTGLVDGKCYQISLWPNDSVRLFFGVFTYLIAFFIPLLMHIFCYGKILKVLTSKSMGTSSVKKKAQRRTIKLLVLVVAACFICITWNLNIIFLYYLGIDLDFQGWSYNLSVVMIYLNALVNPFIYLIFYKRYRLHLRNGLKRILCCTERQASREESVDIDTVTVEITHF